MSFRAAVEIGGNAVSLAGTLTATGVRSGTGELVAYLQI